MVSFNTVDNLRGTVMIMITLMESIRYSCNQRHRERYRVQLPLFLEVTERAFAEDIYW